MSPSAEWSTLSSTKPRSDSVPGSAYVPASGVADGSVATGVSATGAGVCAGCCTPQAVNNASDSAAIIANISLIKHLKYA